VSSGDRDQVLRIALTHFAAPRPPASTMAQLLEDVGGEDEISERYGDGDGLFAAAVEYGTRELRKDIAELAASDGAAADRLYAVTRRLGSPSEDERTALFCVFSELLAGQPRATLAFDACLRETFDHLMAAIGEAQIRGDVTPLPPRSIATVLLCGVLLPQLIGMGTAEGDLQGVHARYDDDAEHDLETKPRSALLAGSLQAVFSGLLPRDEPSS